MPGIKNLNPKIRKAYDEAQAKKQEELRQQQAKKKEKLDNQVRRRGAKKLGISEEEWDRGLAEFRKRPSIYSSSTNE